MCRMTETGVRWARTIPLPDFGEMVTFWAVRYGEDTRYVAEPPAWQRDNLRAWLKPLYAIRIKARSI